MEIDVCSLIFIVLYVATIKQEPKEHFEWIVCTAKHCTFRGSVGFECSSTDMSCVIHWIRPDRLIVFIINILASDWSIIHF